MPELPDVATFKVYLDSTALHKRIQHTTVTDERILHGVSRQKLARRLKGNSLEGTTRHGKFMFVELKKGGWLILHFGMTGELSYYKKGGERPEHARFVLDFENGYQMAYICQRLLGEVGLTDEVSQFVEARGMGPDAMSDELDSSRFRQLLEGHKGMIKPALMNQSIIAGIGNVYSDEILFQAGIHPETHVDHLGDEDMKRLYGVMRRVLRVCSEKQADVDRLPRGYIIPHRQEGDRCPRCGGKVRKKTVSGRSGYFCWKCQKKK